MAVKVRVPGSLRKWFDGKDVVTCTGSNIAECIEDLNVAHPGICDRLIDEEGATGRVLIFLNGDNIGSLNGLQTTVGDGDEISIIPLAAGG
ncbi:MoaD/ThiS family protein [Desulfoglaeba alkanexedens]|uniref:MoaD/ThiS family protein n=1 Tax=Desulfoglaeba alkanexedens ALDC TaxID=980445 RepID=A0A4P8L2X9_9BACT|nr:MoaD/ThiS family protein [Desulfoglaeba alkanexedens]QCQ22287.1 MoaD/ThiS family protein [Desulfoglaeba alkanexedens ALDC]